jgi:hypothetical protein
MEIRHRISFNSSKDIEIMHAANKYEIDHKTVELPGGGGKLITFMIDETDHRWPQVSKLISNREVVDMSDTYFSDVEIKNAEWLRLISTFEQGYPQPKPHWPIKQLSYEIQCPECAIYKQNNPMRLAKEPSLRKKSFMSLIWTNEILCTPEVIKGLAGIQARGYEDWDAVIHKTGVPSKNVRQAYVPGKTSPGVNIDEGLKRKACTSCGAIKYYPHLKGIMFVRKDALPTNVDFVLSHEWFGHGLLSWREIFVSNRIARLILDKGWQGVRFKVIELV